MPIPEYESAQKKVPKWINSIELLKSKAWITGLETLLDPAENLYDLSKLSDPGVADTMSRAVAVTLHDGAKKYLKVSDADASDPFRSSLMLYGLTGLSGQDDIKRVLYGIAQNGEDLFNPGTFLKYTQEAFEPIAKTISTVPLNFLKPEDAPAVIKKVDPTNQYTLDPAAEIFKDNRVLASLLGEYARNQVLTRPYIDRNPQIFRDGKKRSGLVGPDGAPLA